MQRYRLENEQGDDYQSIHLVSDPDEEPVQLEIDMSNASL
jgi:hypothetical protein